MKDDADDTQMSGQTRELRKRFERDVLPLARGLRGAAWSYTRNMSDAEDLVQETLLRAFKAFNRFQENTYLKAWLLTIMRNTRISGYRASRHRPAESLVPDFSDFEEAVAGRAILEMTASAEQQVLHHAIDSDVQLALLALTSELRETLLLVAVTHMNYREVGEVLGISPQTVGSRMHRIRKVLRERLAGFERDTLTQFRPDLAAQADQNRTDAA
jgi:RNA polymerase sigma-70 factor (ECF subfamily)